MVLMSVILMLLLLTPIVRQDRLSRRGSGKSITPEVIHFDLTARFEGLAIFKKGGERPAIAEDRSCASSRLSFEQCGARTCRPSAAAAKSLHNLPVFWH
jgi:hypothetical protein